MKPVSVRFRCFGPYMDEQFVDFEELGSRGIFLICGETGSGKTTILDAICYALFGKSSGGLRQGIEVMRCKAAKAADRTLVEYIFDSGGNRYRFHRELRFGRKNLMEEDGCEILRDGVYVPLFQNPTATAVNKKAEEILGLTYDQFCQVVMLPQGKFERLLVSNSEEKERILTSLFHADRWNAIVLGVKARADEETKRLEKELADLQGQLRVYGCETVDGLKEKLAAKEEEAVSLAAAVREADDLRKQTARAYEDSSKENEICTALEDCRKKLDPLERQAEAYDRRREALKRSEAADAIRETYTAYAGAKKDADTAVKDLENAETARTEAAGADEAARRAKERHEEGRAAFEKNKEALTRLRDARERYAGMGEKKKAAEKAAEEEKKKETAADSAKKAYETARGKWEKARKANDDAVSAYLEMSRRYAANIAGNLASKLEDGVPCPVCGSTEHPAPAALAGGVPVSEEDVETANRAIETASSALSAAKTAMDGAEQANARAAEAFTAAQKNAAAAKTAYELSLRDTIEGVRDSEDLEAWIRKVEGRIKAFEQAEQTVENGLREAAAALSAARQRESDARDKKKSAEKNLEEESRNWAAALREKGFADEAAFRAALRDKETLVSERSEITAYYADLKTARDAFAEQQKKTEGLEAPEMKALQAARQQAEDAWKEKNDAFTMTSQTAGNMKELHAALSSRWERYLQEKTVADANADFARKLNSSTGLSLQRYVLGIMLTSITVAANQLLKTVRGGRYQLYRSYESSGSARKAGLELDVLDISNGEKRSVTTLSGGEKFLLALSLAIGLSTVVQAQSGGTRLEAMFIDEGFGSLDSECIDDAMNILQGVQKSHGLVGIISHVEKLSEIIPTRLEVVTAAGGNQIRPVIS
jgi:DNA repair exonuclease SbcCD ATPase subunit